MHLNYHDLKMHINNNPPPSSLLSSNRRTHNNFIHELRELWVGNHDACAAVFGGLSYDYTY